MLYRRKNELYHAGQYNGDIGHTIQHARLSEIDILITITNLVYVNNMLVSLTDWVVQDGSVIMVLTDKSFKEQFTKV